MFALRRRREHRDIQSSRFDKTRFLPRTREPPQHVASSIQPSALVGLGFPAGYALNSPRISSDLVHSGVPRHRRNPHLPRLAFFYPRRDGAFSIALRPRLVEEVGQLGVHSAACGWSWRGSTRGCGAAGALPDLQVPRQIDPATSCNDLEQT